MATRCAFSGRLIHDAHVTVCCAELPEPSIAERERKREWGDLKKVKIMWEKEGEGGGYYEEVDSLGRVNGTKTSCTSWYNERALEKDIFGYSVNDSAGRNMVHWALAKWHP